MKTPKIIISIAILLVVQSTILFAQLQLMASNGCVSGNFVNNYGKWKIVTVGDLVTDKNLSNEKTNKKTSNISNKPKGIKGDYNGDGKFEYVILEQPKFPENPAEEDFMSCIGECDSYLTFSNKMIPSIKIKNCIGGEPVNEGDLNNDGTDEIGILPSWWTSCWRSYLVYTYKNGKWEFLVDPISTHCSSWTKNFNPIEKDRNSVGKVIIRYTEMSEDSNIILKTKSIKVD